MIVRILGEGQYRVDESALAGLNASDDKVQAALDAGDQAALSQALGALLDGIRQGERLADDDLSESELIVPDQGATVEDVRAMLADSGSTDGLIPG